MTSPDDDRQPQQQHLSQRTEGNQMGPSNTAMKDTAAHAPVAAKAAQPEAAKESKPQPKPSQPKGSVTITLDASSVNSIGRAASQFRRMAKDVRGRAEKKKKTSTQELHEALAEKYEREADALEAIVVAISRG